MCFADDHSPAVVHSDDDDDKDDGLWSDTEFEEFEVEQVNYSFMYRDARKGGSRDLLELF